MTRAELESLREICLQKLRIIPDTACNASTRDWYANELWWIEGKIKEQGGGQCES